MSAELLAFFLQLGRVFAPDAKPTDFARVDLDEVEAANERTRARISRLESNTRRLNEARIVYERAQNAAEMARREYVRVFCETNPSGCEETYGPK